MGSNAGVCRAGEHAVQSPGSEVGVAGCMYVERGSKKRRMVFFWVSSFVRLETRYRFFFKVEKVRK